MHLDLHTVRVTRIPVGSHRTVSGGECLTWDEAAQTLEYTVSGRSKSQWRVFHVDSANGLMAARSSVTGTQCKHLSTVATTRAVAAQLDGVVEPRACMGT